MAERSEADTEKIRNRMLLAAKIEDAVKKKGWKNKDLAKALNKKPSVITKWLSGTHNFTIDTLTEIGLVLETDFLNIDNKPKEIVNNYHMIVTSEPVNEMNYRGYPLLQTSNILSEPTFSYKTKNNA